MEIGSVPSYNFAIAKKSVLPPDLKCLFHLENALAILYNESGRYGRLAPSVFFC
jgi:hypothetical protein